MDNSKSIDEQTCENCDPKCLIEKITNEFLEKYGKKNIKGGVKNINNNNKSYILYLFMIFTLTVMDKFILL